MTDLTSRRDFLKTSGIVVPSIAIPAFNIIKNKQGLDDIQVGLIGCNGMGWANLQSMLRNGEIQVRAICDVDKNVLTKRVAECRENLSYEPTQYSDYRQLLADPQIDVVIIGTPDHWHCKIMVDACVAGKDVYVEKPIANSIEECRIMEKAVSLHNRVVQVGQWQRSGPHFKDAIDFVWSGELGNIRLVKTWAYQGWMKAIPPKPDEPVPEGVDYKMWLGPAPARAFNPNRFHFNFRWYWDYAGGLMTDWGVHLVDIALWGMKAKVPKTVYAAGGKLAYPNDASETPDTLQAIYEYEGFNMIWEHGTGIDSANFGRNHGIAFIGNNGTLVVDRAGWEVIPEKGKMDAVNLKERTGSDLDRHIKNFLDAVRSRNVSLLNGPIEVGSTAAVNCHMGNVAFKSDQKIHWNFSKQAFTDKKANKLIRAQYHNHWDLPNI
ncbi:MAG: Gfo/Idh/MocA family oxidoreductase [Saprospiraceae bacterium]|nr:Gfo/Idh/MocA family oxidoreductase [Saprospiraceae bacterium]